MSVKNYPISKALKNLINQNSASNLFNPLNSIEDAYIAKDFQEVITSTLSVESEFGAIRITGIPIKSDDENNQLMKSICDLIGDAVGFSGENNATMVQNLAPSAEHIHSKAGTGSKVDLEAHSDLAHLYPYNPDYLMLFCINSGSGEQPKTTLFDINDLGKYVSKETFEHLKNTRYQYDLPESFKGDLSFSKKTLKCPIIQEGNRLESCFQFNTMRPIDEKSSDILSDIKSIVSKNSDYIKFETGDLVILKNKRMLHGRSSFIPNFNEQTRLLKRLYVTKSINNIKEFTHYQINSLKLLDSISYDNEIQQTDVA